MRVRTMSPESPIFYKRADAFTFRSYNCLRCAANYRCVTGSRVGLTKAEYVLSLMHFTEQTPSMAAGAALHAEFSKETPELKGLSKENYYGMLRSGSTVTVKEALACVMTGYAGKVDLLSVTRTPPGEYFVEIQENKSHPAGHDWYVKWMLQVAEYGYIFNHTDMVYLHADHDHWWPAWLPEDRDPVVNVRAFIHYLDGSRPDTPDGMFSMKNKIEESWMFPWVNLMKKRAAEKYALHRRGLYAIDIPDEPEPRFFGRRKLLIKTPPRPPPRDNFP